ncbi:MAG: sugar phosphate isomerase/epimerase family protein [Thermoproteota archaeon]
MEILLFAKMFQSLPLPDFAKVVTDMNFDGVDLTVRPNGYVKPEDVEEKLPESIEILRKENLSVPMITTSIIRADEPYAEETFRIASRCGVRYLKLGYWTYEGFGRLRAQIEEARNSLKGIQELSKRYGITAAVHSHSGMFLTAEPSVMDELLTGFDPDLVGAYIDPGHMVVEGGLAGWLMGMDILSKKIRMVAVKDFAWFEDAGNWKAEVVPLGEGLVPWREVFRILKGLNFEGPISLHSEYEGLPLEHLIEQTRRDLEFIRNLLSSL